MIERLHLEEITFESAIHSLEAEIDSADELFKSCSKEMKFPMNN